MSIYAYHEHPGLCSSERARRSTCADETTLYYWALLPAPAANGSWRLGRPVAYQSRELSESGPAGDRDLPAKDAVLAGTQPQFPMDIGDRSRKLPAPGLDRPHFGSKLLDNVVHAVDYNSA